MSMINIYFFLLSTIVFVIIISKVNSLNAYIHIGPHKTGSTEIQELIFNNVNTFKNYNISTVGFGIFPKAMDTFANIYLINDNHSEWVDNIIEQIKTSENDILISSETFDAMNITEIMKLKELLNGYNVTIIAIHRARLSHIHSYWAQIIGNRYHYIVDFNEYLVSTSKQYGHNYEIGWNFKVVLELYSKIFGSNNIKVISFEGAALKYNYHQSSIFYAMVEEVLNLPIDSFINLQKEFCCRNYFEIDLKVIIKKFNVLRDCTFHSNTSLVNTYVINSATTLPKSTKFIYPSSQFINDDLSIISDYTYYLIPPNNVYSDPLEYETLCLECLSDYDMKTWKSLLKNVSVCQESGTVTVLTNICTALLILILFISLSLVYYDKKIKEVSKVQYKEYDSSE